MAPALLLLLIAVPTSTASAAPKELWAGRAEVIGHRSVPFLGKVEARTKSWVLAEVVRRGDRISLVQRACDIELTNPTGVKLSLVAPQKLPPVRLDFERHADGRWYQGPQASGWEKEDVDGDGKPGMTVNVDAPICGGKIFAAVRTVNRARGGFDERGVMRGELRSEVHQEVLDTDGACLGVLIKSSDERVQGAFSYVKVDPAATCASWTKDSWPVDLDPVVSSPAPKR